MRHSGRWQPLLLPLGLGGLCAAYAVLALFWVAPGAGQRSEGSTVSAMVGFPLPLLASSPRFPAQKCIRGPQPHRYSFRGGEAGKVSDSPGVAFLALDWLTVSPALWFGMLPLPLGPPQWRG